MDKCKKCHEKYQTGQSGYCAACLQSAQADLISRWDQLEKPEAETEDQ